MAAKVSCEPRCALLFTRARAAYELRQLRPEVGQEPQERSTVLKLRLGFIGCEVSVHSLETDFCLGIV